MLKENQLYHYQQEVVNSILKTKRIFVTQEMGLGKTITSITAFTKVLNKEVKKCLIIAPLNVAKSTWVNELSKWEHTKNLKYSLAIGNEKQRLDALQKEADVYIINQENVPWMFHNGFKKYGFIIVDESTGFKSHSSNRFKALRHFTSLYMVLLTGTPYPNGFMDLWSQIYLLDKGQRLGKYITHYRNQYFSYDEHKRKYTCLFPNTILDKIKDITISMKAEDYLELPDKIFNVVKVDIDNYGLYKKFEKEYYLRINNDEITAVNAAVLSSKLLQYCNGAVYSSENDGLYTIIHNNKIEYLKEFIELYQDENILVAYNFKSDEERIRLAIPSSITLNRNNIVDVEKRWNKGEIKLLLCQSGTAKGLNLQYGGRIIVWFGITYNLEHYLQFNARLHRQGQTKPVLVYHIVANKCKDEQVMKILDNKNTTSEMIYEVLKNPN
jgi:SNF2 family DNA or RNA helicase